MTLDAWLFERHIQGHHPPTLRFYTWEPAAISLGYHQRNYPDHWNNLTWQGRSLDIVQRPTGGRAVLHQGDLTYAVITSGLSGNRMESYRQICEFLIQGWRSLGVELQYGTAGRGYIHNSNCFGTATAADLTMPNGFKLIGSAQLRRGGIILQHGSIRLNPDVTLFQQVFQSDPIEPIFPDSLLKKISVEQIISALTESAKACFDVDFHHQPLSEAEWNVLSELPIPNSQP
ncbi:lipoate--protein ligase family protein [Phormidium sp. CLA17]|nr:lipoate--protein ligase family protein [Leptolyngbya sp. Cla-17]